MLSDDFLLNERTEKDDSTEDEDHKTVDNIAEEVNVGGLVDDGKGEGDGQGNGMPRDPAPLFMEQFNKMKTKVSPTERELRALSLANLENDELKQMGGVG